MAMVFCRGCGKEIHETATSCPRCGAKQGLKNSATKSKIAAALFALFLGCVGAHKFYLGKIGLGFLYLCFFWTFIPSFVAFIEFILLLAMSDERFDEKYNT